MDGKYYADIVINKEKLSNGDLVFVAHCTNLGIASQGNNFEEAMENIKEAIELYLEEQPEDYEKLEIQGEPPVFSIIEINKNAKATDTVR
jgi:predicted RNase H-like HicB family nuclease